MSGRSDATAATWQGFQTILFTDIESSTALTQRLGDEGPQELLRRHDTTVRTALDQRDLYGYGSFRHERHWNGDRLILNDTQLTRG